MPDFSGRTVLISGVARGQGRSHALHIARSGGRIAGVDICQDIPGLRGQLATKNDLDTLRQELTDIGAEFALDVVDVRDEERLRTFVTTADAELGPIDGVITNAGVWEYHGSLWDMDPSAWSTVLDVNLTGCMNLLRVAAPAMVERQRGAVVFIGSVNSVEPHFGYGSYVVAKHAVIGLMRQAAVELAPYNIRANSVCPGMIDTSIWNNPMGYEMIGVADRAGAVDRVYGTHLLAGRGTLPASAISKAVMWLLSDDAEHVTGTNLPVEAGHFIMSGFNHDPQRTGPHADRHRPPADTPR